MAPPSWVCGKNFSSVRGTALSGVGFACAETSWAKPAVGSARGIGFSCSKKVIQTKESDSQGYVNTTLAK